MFPAASGRHRRGIVFYTSQNTVISAVKIYWPHKRRCFVNMSEITDCKEFINK